MPKKDASIPEAGHDHSATHPVLPDAEEEHASLVAINNWVLIGDAAMGIISPTRKKA
jgi:hypothetical protein